MQKIKVATMSRSDVDEVMQIEKECPVECWNKTNYEESLKNPAYDILVAKSENEILGFVSMYAAVDEGYICNIAVRKAAQNQGIGTRLITKTMELSKAKNLKFLSLEVRESNVNAIAFYEKLGFANLGVRKNFYSNPSEHAIIMTKYF